MSVFVDANVLVAGALPSERAHAKAVRLLRETETQGPFTTDHVLVEAWHVLRARKGFASALRFWQSLAHTPLTIEAVSLPDLERARAIAELWQDQEFDLVDCASFAVMERVGCARAASFDRDFAVYRFGPGRARAFEILG
ncbi:MAG: PIN domain-containing protein [Actinomycetota bacterium]